MSLDARYRAALDTAGAHGQAHVLGAWERLDDDARRTLLEDVERVDFALCASLIGEYVRERPRIVIPDRIEAPPVLNPKSLAMSAEWTRAWEAGESAIREGRVAAFTVAGGQGTRLGYDGPKGGYRVSPVREAPLFQVFAEGLRGVQRRFGRLPRWYIMTSPGNHDATQALFEQSGWYGLPREAVRFFTQGQMPAFLPDGQIAMSERHRIALSPDGHGGSLRALRDSGALEEMRNDGVEQISYFQVDNPLVHIIDPLFIGLHLVRQSEMSSKAVTKASDTERVGNFCLADGRLCVIEYSDLPEALALRKNPDGSRTFDAGSIAIHVIDRAFVERVTAPGAAARLPWHRADKRVAVVDPMEAAGVPRLADVVKLEMFVFDAIPLARNAMVMYTPREEEFSPVKNAEGADSPATSRRDQVRRAARWLREAGVRVPSREDGEPDAIIEISPAFALDAADLRSRPLPGAIERGSRVVLE
ncbi:MAG: UTP--glucose-1-phosphate uridylyltransferase [Planctomycetia bacterium]|nr:MAG: UTP--glucose-1-phosphate uridylyltransferase [Planctomycetia bacterium]